MALYDLPEPHSAFPVDSFAVTSSLLAGYFPLDAHDPGLLDQQQFPAADPVLFLPESLHTLHLYWESSHLANPYLPFRTLPLRSGIYRLAASDFPGCFLKMQNLRPHPSPVESESIL